jgi:chemotaxis protein MotA
MDFGSILGIIISLGGILAGYVLEEGVISALWQKTSFFIVFGGTIGAVVLSYPMPELAKIPGALKTVFTIKKYDEISIINRLAELSEKARKDGLLSLEQDAQADENVFIRKGLSLVVDGTEIETIKDILGREVELRESIYESTARIFETAGGFGPTMGVLGTVMGMISILGSMEEDPGGLGGKIATAFIATMYGVGSANIVDSHCRKD